MLTLFSKFILECVYAVFQTPEGLLERLGATVCRFGMANAVLRLELSTYAMQTREQSSAALLLLHQLPICPLEGFTHRAQFHSKAFDFVYFIQVLYVQARPV
jgi:hypothetical protein